MTNKAVKAVKNSNEAFLPKFCSNETILPVINAKLKHAVNFIHVCGTNVHPIKGIYC